MSRKRKRKSRILDFSEFMSEADLERLEKALRETRPSELMY